MRRRDFVAAIAGSVAALPFTARAQQAGGMRIGVLMGFAERDRQGLAYVAALREGLQKLGWAEDRNLRIDTRWAKPDDPEARQRFAKELVALGPALILSHNTPTTTALLRETRTIPIIFAIVSDPVG